MDSIFSITGEMQNDRKMSIIVSLKYYILIAVTVVKPLFQLHEILPYHLHRGTPETAGLVDTSFCVIVFGRQQQQMLLFREGQFHLMLFRF